MKRFRDQAISRFMRRSTQLLLKVSHSPTRPPDRMTTVQIRCCPEAADADRKDTITVAATVATPTLPSSIKSMMIRRRTG